MRNISLVGLVLLAAACTETKTITKTITETKTVTETIELPGGTVTNVVEVDADCDNDADGNPVTCFLSGTIIENSTLTADVQWVLRGGVFVGDDTNETVLTIEAGTEIFGDVGTSGMLVVRRGSQLVVQGTEAAPVVMTSANDPGSRSRGDWGGLIINGRAPINNCNPDLDGCEQFGEGGTGFFGGDVPTDSSGAISYLRVEFAGTLISPDNELNGIAFQGVGSGTSVDHVQVHMNADDGIEFFGGTVDAKYLITTGIGDDNLDWTDGWVGRLQYFVAQQYDGDGDQGIEADNNAESPDISPRSNPVISNVTLVGSPASDKSDFGMLLREGTAGQIWNPVVTEFNDACLALDQTQTLAQADSGNLVIANGILNCATPFDQIVPEDDNGDPLPPLVTTAETQAFYESGPNNTLGDPGLIDPTNEATPNFAPAAGSLAATGATQPTDAWFDAAVFRGGVDPANDWTQGWTTSDPN